MRIRQTAIDAAAWAIASRQGRKSVTGADYDLATTALFAIAPVVLEAERERVRSLIDPGKMEALAAWLDAEGDRLSCGEFQSDLRQWALILRGVAAPSPGLLEVMSAGAATLDVSFA